MLKRFKLQPEQQKLLDYSYGLTITDIKICRKPITKIIMNVLNVLSFGQFKENLKNSPYDKLFHLSMYITLNNGYKFVLEKNERVNYYGNQKYITSDMDIMNVPLNKIILINNLIDNTIKNIGKEHFYTYKSYSWNCQDFVISVLKSNLLLNNELETFILQDTEYLFKNLGYLKYLSDKITNLGSDINIIYHGGNISNYKIQSVIFNKKMFDKNNSIEWLKKHNYKFNKIDETKNYLRFRQINPSYIKKIGYNKYETIDLNNGVLLIGAYF